MMDQEKGSLSCRRPGSHQLDCLDLAVSQAMPLLVTHRLKARSWHRLICP